MLRIVSVDTSVYGSLKLPDLPLYVGEEISQELCQEAMKLLLTAETLPSGVFSDDNKYELGTGHRTSVCCLVPQAMHEIFHEIFYSVLVRQCSHKIGAKSFSRPEPLQFLRYDGSKKSHFSTHTDSGYFSGGKFMHTSPRRLLSIIAHLNSDFVGGETEFPNITGDTGRSLKIRPAPGTMIIFPSDIRYPHKIYPVTQGSRFTVVGWYDVAWR